MVSPALQRLPVALRIPALIAVLVLIAATLIAPRVNATPTATPADMSDMVATDDAAAAPIAGTGEMVSYSVVDDLAVVDGDVIVGTHSEVQANGIDPAALGDSPTCPEGLQCSLIDTRERRKWTDGVVPYTIANGSPANVQRAIDHWEERTSIRFVPRSDEPDYVEFVSTGNGSTCSSYLGRVGGRQPINYARDGRGCLVHEIGHAVGLSHEQNRSDRDQHITIDFTAMIPGAESQFRIANGSTDVGPYDFSSVMHYGAFTFARSRNNPVIRPRDPNIPLSAVGGTTVLSPIDVQGIEFVYGNTPPPPPTTSTTAAPTTTEAPTTTTTEAATTTTEASTTTTEASTTTTAAPTTSVTVGPPTMPSTTTMPAPTPSTTAPSTSTTAPKATTTVAPTSTTARQTTTTVAPTSTSARETTTTVAPTTTTAPETTTTTERPRPPVPTNQRPVVNFVGLSDGDTVGTQIPYGGIQVTAHDPDVGTADGDGIRWVMLVVRDAETGRFITARREYWSTYDFGLRLRSGRSYTLSAYAVSSGRHGCGWSVASVTVNAE